jgi:RNA polymerase sigma-70 factor, ECF subfamily
MLKKPPDNNFNDDNRAKLFVTLLAQCERALNGYIISLVPNWNDADDILQETKLRLWEQFDNYDRQKDFGAWSRTVAHFQILTYRKQSSRQSVRFTKAFVDLVAVEAGKVAIDAQLRHRLLGECLATLSDAGRKLLTMCYSGKLSIKDVALKLGRSVRGLQQAVANLRKNLQQCIEDRLHKEECE